MLWDVGRRSVSPAVIERLEESELGRPIVVCHRRRRISEDLANSLLEYASIAVHVPEHRLENARVIDIGAGYGRFADLFLMAHEEARVLVVDIPPALALSQAYLTARHPDLPAHRFARGIDAAALHEAISRSQLGFVTPNQFASLAPLGFDLVVNVSSLHEMTHEQVAEYLRLIDYHAAGGFFYTKQWGHWRNEIDDVDTDRDSYPYPATWRRLLDRTPVAQPAFFEALFAVNPE
jgi:putative sugar O-methyltransferase